MHVEKRGGATFALVHHRATECGGPGERIYKPKRRILYCCGLAKFRFVANITTACQPEIKSEVRLAVAVTGSPGSLGLLFSDDMTLDKPRHKA